jgi:hypothetical protein
MRGGVARYYRGDLQANERVSTEITGYSVSSLVYLFQRTGDTACLHAARLAGDFLLHDAWNRELKIFPFEHSFHGDAPEPLAYFFDSGIIVRGLLALWRATGDKRYLEGAREGGASMGRYFRSGGRIHPILQLPDMQPLPYTDQWSRGPGCYQLKAAMAWSDLHRITGESRFREWYEAALASALQSHADFLPAKTPDRTMDRLHAYSYFLEGLMPVADRVEVRAALREGIFRTAAYLREIAPQFERSDVYGQLLRARLFADRLAAIPVDKREATEEAERIPGFQINSRDFRCSGGYAFGRRAGAIMPHMNPVSTAFCSQALEMWSDFEAGQPLDLQSLV